MKAIKCGLIAVRRAAPKVQGHDKKDLKQAMAAKMVSALIMAWVTTIELTILNVGGNFTKGTKNRG